MSIATKTKNVSNLMLTICALLDILEQPELDVKNLARYDQKINTLFYDVDRHIKRRCKDEFYHLDFTSHDLLALTQAADVHLKVYTEKCSLASLREQLYSLPMDTPEGYKQELINYHHEIGLGFFALSALRRIVSAANYQILVLEILEQDKESCKIENVFLDAVREELCRI